MLDETIISIPAIRGQQGQDTIYICHFTFEQLANLMQCTGSNVPITEKAQRNIENARVNRIVSYIEENSSKELPYIIPPIIASIQAERLDFELINGSDRIGKLSFPLTSKILINDGQHRHAGIARLIKEKNMLHEDSIGVWLMPDLHLEKSQQFFSDINRHAKPVSSSLNRLYDHRCLQSTTTRMVLEEVPFFTKFVEVEKISCSKNKLILLETLHKANNKYFPEPNPDKLVDFWNTITTNVPEWEYIWNISCNPSNNLAKEINTLKRDTIAFSTTFIFAIASLGNEINPDKLIDLELEKENSKLIDAGIIYENPATNELKVVRGGAGIEKMKDYLIGEVLLTI